MVFSGFVLRSVNLRQEHSSEISRRQPLDSLAIQADVASGVADGGVVTFIKSDPPFVRRSNRPLDAATGAFLGDSSQSRHQGGSDSATAVLLADEQVIEPKSRSAQERGERRVIGCQSDQCSVGRGYQSKCSGRITEPRFSQQVRSRLERVGTPVKIGLQSKQLHELREICSDGMPNDWIHHLPTNTAESERINSNAGGSISIRLCSLPVDTS